MKDKIGQILKDNLNFEEIYKYSEIKKILINNGIKSPPQITSMTYNRWNKGMKNLHLNPLFEYIKFNSYRYLGHGFPYNGDVFNNPKSKSIKPIKIGYWMNGQLFDFENELYKFDFDFSILNKNKFISTDSKDYLFKLGFEEIGEYILKDEKVSVKYTVKKTERVSLVYALTIGKDVFYLGKTVQGYFRPLDYHKNNVMKNVKNGIEKYVFDNKNVNVLAKRFEEVDMTDWNDLKLNIIEAVEQALIIKLNPEWNRYSHK